MHQSVWFVLYFIVCVRVCVSDLVGRNHYEKLHLKDMQNSKPSTVPWLFKGSKPQQVKQTQMKVRFIIIQCTVVCALHLWPRVTGQCYMPVEEAILWKEELLTFFISA